MTNICSDRDLENVLEKFVREGYILHGSPYRYEEHENKVFVPRNHKIRGNKTPVNAIYHALFDNYRTILKTHYEKGHLYSSVIVRDNHDAIREKGMVYVFSSEDFIKQNGIYKKIEGRPLLETIAIIPVTIDDFKPPIYETNFKMIKGKTF
jgi:hypothetical protein